MASELPVECDECGMLPEITEGKFGWSVVCPDGHCMITEETYEKAVLMWNKLNENFGGDLEE